MEVYEHMWQELKEKLKKHPSWQYSDLHVLMLEIETETLSSYLDELYRREGEQHGLSDSSSTGLSTRSVRRE